MGYSALWPIKLKFKQLCSKYVFWSTVAIFEALAWLELVQTTQHYMSEGIFLIRSALLIVPSPGLSMLSTEWLGETSHWWLFHQWLVSPSHSYGPDTSSMAGTVLAYHFCQGCKLSQLRVLATPTAWASKNVHNFAGILEWKFTCTTLNETEVNWIIFRSS